MYAFPILALALLGASPSPKQGVLLRRTFAPNFAAKYRLESKGETKTAMPNGMADMEMTVTSSMDLAQRVVKVAADAKSADLESKMTNIVFDLQSPMGTPPGAQMPKEIVVTQTTDELNRVTNIKSSYAAANPFEGDQTMAGLGGIFSFPSKQVAIGESWDVETPETTMMKKGKATTTLIGEKDEKGTPVWVLGVKAELPLKLDSAKMASTAGAPPMNITGTVHFTGEVEVLKSDGSLFSMNLKAATDTEIEIESAGITLHSSGTSSSTMTRVP